MLVPLSRSLLVSGFSLNLNDVQRYIVHFVNAKKNGFVQITFKKRSYSINLFVLYSLTRSVTQSGVQRLLLFSLKLNICLSNCHDYCKFLFVYLALSFFLISSLLRTVYPCFFLYLLILQYPNPKSIGGGTKN